jgi:hypothetical protein
MMNAIVICSDVRPATDNDGASIVVVSRDETVAAREADPTDISNLSEVRKRLHAQGMTLGEQLQRARTSGSDMLCRPDCIVAHDEQGKRHRLTIESLEDYSLSSGSTLYFLRITESLSSCRWLVGRTLELRESEG